MFDINESQRAAGPRLRRNSSRRRRSDAGRSRLHPIVLAEIRSAALGRERPSMIRLQRRLADVCAAHGLQTPSRASLYNALSRVEASRYDVRTLPVHVTAALYNLPADGVVPGHQLAFYCFNYGPVSAASFAAGLPWLDLYQASRLRGWRPRSRGLLAAVMRVRRTR